MKKSLRNLTALTLTVTAALTLTACDPPLPPDVAAQIAEQTYTCLPGDVSVASSAEMADPLSQWQASLSFSCTDPLPAMTITPVTDSGDLVISATTPDTCTPFSTVPLALDSGVVAFSVSVTSTLNLTPKTLAAIFDSKITSWDAPEIAAENPDTQMPAEPIQVRKTADAQAFEALSAWFQRQGVKLDASKFDLVATKDLGDTSFLAEGELAILPGSIATANSLYPVAIKVGKDIANPDVQGTSSAASQWVPKQNGNDVSVTLDANLAPIAQAGFDDAAVPYQAIYPVNLYLCGDDTLLKRAVALYLLRMDSQGVLGLSNYNQLSEGTRIIALATVRQGLPEPKPTDN